MATKTEAGRSARRARTRAGSALMLPAEPPMAIQSRPRITRGLLIAFSARFVRGGVRRQDAQHLGQSRDLQSLKRPVAHVAQDQDAARGTQPTVEAEKFPQAGGAQAVDANQIQKEWASFS